MKRKIKRLCTCLLALLLAFSMAMPALGYSTELNDAASCVYQSTQNPQIGSIGGEWAVIGLSRSGYEAPEEYYRDYFLTVEKSVKKQEGILSSRKYSEYSRVVLGLASIGADPRNVAGYDLTKPLGDYEKTILQGVNGPIYALLALDSRNYPMPKNPEAKTQATRQMYVDSILNSQLADGGWSLTNKSPADPDTTAMALQALVVYRDQKSVAAAVEKGLACLSALQDSSGGFSSWNADNSESCAQAMIALCELKIELSDPRFVKNGNTVLDAFMRFYVPGKGFRHTPYEEPGQMATEQALCALGALKRYEQGENSFYRMSDVAAMRHPAVKAVPVGNSAVNFRDIEGNSCKAAVISLAQRKIISGKSKDCFDPNANMTRAEFATIVVRSLGLSPKANSRFTDVPPGSWYAPYVGTASDYGIVSGVGNKRFNPNGLITYQEAAVMTVKAAKLCGFDAALTDMEISAALSQYADGKETAGWAKNDMAFCLTTGLWKPEGSHLSPKQPIRRGEVAQILYNLLSTAGLL